MQVFVPAVYFGFIGGGWVYVLTGNPVLGGVVGLVVMGCAAWLMDVFQERA